MTTMEMQGMGEDEARKYFEGERWPNGPVCPFCGDKDVVRIGGRSVRPGLLRCRECRKQFRVTVGTIFEDSHIPLHIWLKAFALVCASKKGVSAHQMHRMFGITYKSAWFMAHRIRHAMTYGPLHKLTGKIVEVDETYVGGKRRLGEPPRKSGRGTPKTPVIALVERGGNMRSRVVKNTSGNILRRTMRETIDKGARIMTDDHRGYWGTKAYFRGHSRVRHSKGEYARGDVNVNSAESFFALFKRGLHGTYHHVSKHHLDKYCNEFAFRWNNRNVSDVERTAAAARMIEGKRMTYRLGKLTAGA